jgi:hypothetical protein
VFSSTSFSAAEARPVIRPISCGRKGSGRLRSRIEQALRAELRLELLDPRQQLADPDLAQLLQLQRELAAAPVERRLPLITTRWPSAGAGTICSYTAARAGHAHRHVLRRVAQRQKHHPGAGTAADLGDLPLHVDHAEPVDPLRHQRRDRRDRHRRFEGAVQGHGPTLELGVRRYARRPAARGAAVGRGARTGTRGARGGGCAELVKIQGPD